MQRADEVTRRAIQALLNDEDVQDATAQACGKWWKAIEALRQVRAVASPSAKPSVSTSTRRCRAGSDAHPSAARGRSIQQQTLDDFGTIIGQNMRVRIAKTSSRKS